MKPLLLLLLVPMVLPAQAFVSLDLSGDWRLALDDRPAYAAADFDDRAWKTLVLPRGEEFFHGVDYWLRRRVDLPAGMDRQQLTLSLGASIGVYEVYLNGQRIGSTGSFESLAEARIPRPLTFDIPPEALAAGPAQVIALRVRAQLFFHPDWRLQP